MNKKKLPDDPDAPSASLVVRLSPLLPAACFLVGAVLLALVLFKPVWGADKYLFATDDNIGVAHMWHDLLPAAFLAAWQDALLVGMPTMRTLSWTHTMLWLLPPQVYKDWLIAIDCIIGSLFLALFLRRHGVGWAGCAMGALTAFWLGTNFTLLYAGHTPKFGVLMFSAVFLYLYDRALSTRHPAWAALAGGAFGMMFLEQADVGLFFAILLGPYALFAFWDRHRPSLSSASRDVPTALRLLLPLFGVAFLLAVHPLLSGYRTFAAGDQNGVEKDPQQEWEFLTQWSWPPRETIDFIAPGYTGWRSGEPEGPYWGKMGQSAGWTLSQPQGFRNFKLENHYIGALPCGFLVFALWLAILRRRRGDATSNEVIAWGVLALVAFLLSCGKYLPFIYKPFLMLPAVSSIRNPNKFLQILQIIMGILAAFGFDALLGNRRSSCIAGLSRKDRKRFVIAAALFAGLFGFMWIGRSASFGSVVDRLTADGWGAHAEVIVATSSRALAHGALFCILFASLAAFLLLRRQSPSNRTCLIVAWTLVALVAVDAKLLSRHYVYGEDLRPLSENPVGKMLAALSDHQRVALATQQGFYNNWLTDMFPYWGIRSLNTTSAARLPDDYLRFLQQTNRNPFRWWQLGAARFVLGPAQIWQQVQADPRVRDAFDLVYVFNVRPAGRYSIEAVPATQEAPGQHVVLRYKVALPRYALVDDWKIVSDEDILTMLFEQDFDPAATVLLAPRPAGLAPRPAGLAPDSEAAPPAQPNDQKGVHSVTVNRYRAGVVDLKISTDRDAILLISERFHPSWHAWIDNEPAELLRCNGIFQGVKVQAGLHGVRLRYEPPIGTLYVQGLGLAACALAGAFLILTSIRATRPTRSKADPNDAKKE